MKLTTNQLNTLCIVQEEKSLSHQTHKVNTRTMNSLYSKGLVRNANYANGPHWEMTDKGEELLNQKTKK